ncbi:hypothetical protein V2O64_10625 [Verrucomicrobiaceae bacterium 227]
MKILLSLLLLMLGTSLGWGQVAVQLEVERMQYLSHERVMGVVTITNRSGGELSFESKISGGVTRSWLNFSMRDSSGRTKPVLLHSVFRKAVLPAGRSISREVDLSRLFSVSAMGNYSVTAHVTLLDGDGSSYTSNSGHFTVGGGNTIFTQNFGVPKSGAPKRTYNVISFNDGKRTSIYAQVMNVTTGRSISTFRISEYLTFSRPQIAIDTKNQLNVLYLANAEIFVHATINQDGMMTGTKYFQRSNARGPRFVTDNEGRIRVLGATPYDPKKAAAAAPKARSATDRPQ